MDWQPFELRPDAPETGWELPERIKAMKNAPNNPLTARAKQLGITLVQRDVIPSSRRAHECTEYARSQGKLAAFHKAVLEAYWSEGRDLHAWDVLEACATRAEIDPTAMRAEVEAGMWKAAVDERVEAGHDIGVHAVPTFVIAERFMVQGAQTADVFEQVLRKATATERQPSR